MICNNCSAEYDDGAAQCPECGMENESATAAFEEKADTANDGEDTGEAVTDSEAATESENEQDEPCADEEKPEEEKSRADEASTQADKAEELKQEAEKESADGEKEENSLPVKKIRRRPVKRATKKEKWLCALIVVLMCLVGISAAGVSLLNITTDIFKIDDSGEKMVASVGFTPGEEKQLEELLAKCFSVVKSEFGCESTDTESFIARLNPADKGNIYSVVNNVREPLQTTADPAERFADENGEYAYYKLDCKRVDKVLSLFGLESQRGENTEKYYYCDGYYYFDAKSSSTPVVAAEVTKSRRVLDGSYYAECYFYKKGTKETAKTKTCYFVAEMSKDEAEDKADFTIKKISVRPIFGSDGKLLDCAKTFERKTEIIEGRTKDGKLFSRYTVEYPVIEDEGAGYKNVIDFFNNAVSVYQLKAQSADEEYKKFKAAGGDDNQLPYEENVVASIVFDNESSISFKGVISKLSPEVSPEAEADSGIESDGTTQAPRLYERTVEAYTIDKQSGNFVLKDSVVGKDYMLVSEVLYRIYNGYEYESILPSQESTQDSYGEDEYAYSYDEIPDDTDGIGNAIYESAWALTDKGVTFYYVTEKGYVSEVTLPDSAVKKLAE